MRKVAVVLAATAIAIGAILGLRRGPVAIQWPSGTGYTVPAKSRPSSPHNVEPSSTRVTIVEVSGNEVVSRGRQEIRQGEVLFIFPGAEITHRCGSRPILELDDYNGDACRLPCGITVRVDQYGQFVPMTYDRAVRDAEIEEWEATERQGRRATALIGQLREHLSAGEYDGVIERAQQARTEYAGTGSEAAFDSLARQARNRKARAAEDEHRTRQQEKERENQYQELVKDAREELGGGGVSHAIELLSRARAIKETDEVKGLLAEARRTLHLSRAKSAEAAGDLDSAIGLYGLALEARDEAEVRGRLEELKRRKSTAAVAAAGEHTSGEGRPKGQKRMSPGSGAVVEQSLSLMQQSISASKKKAGHDCWIEVADVQLDGGDGSVTLRIEWQKDPSGMARGEVTVVVIFSEQVPVPPQTGLMVMKRDYHLSFLPDGMLCMVSGMTVTSPAGSKSGAAMVLFADGPHSRTDLRESGERTFVLPVQGGNRTTGMPAIQGRGHLGIAVMREADPALSLMKSTRYEMLSNTVSREVDFTRPSRREAGATSADDTSGKGGAAPAAGTPAQPEHNLEVVLRAVVENWGDRTALFKVRRRGAGAGEWLTYTTRPPVKEGEKIRATRETPEGTDEYDTGLVLVRIDRAVRTTRQVKKEYVIEGGEPVRKEVVREVPRRVLFAVVEDTQSGERHELVRGEAWRK